MEKSIEQRVDDLEARAEAHAFMLRTLIMHTCSGSQVQAHLLEMVCRIADTAYERGAVVNHDHHQRVLGELERFFPGVPRAR